MINFPGNCFLERVRHGSTPFGVTLNHSSWNFHPGWATHKGEKRLSDRGKSEKQAVCVGDRMRACCRVKAPRQSSGRTPQHARLVSGEAYEVEFYEPYGIPEEVAQAVEAIEDGLLAQSWARHTSLEITYEILMLYDQGQVVKAHSLLRLVDAEDFDRLARIIVEAQQQVLDGQGGRVRTSLPMNASCGSLAPPLVSLLFSAVWTVFCSGVSVLEWLGGCLVDPLAELLSATVRSSNSDDCAHSVRSDILLGEVGESGEAGGDGLHRGLMSTIGGRIKQAFHESDEHLRRRALALVHEAMASPHTPSGATEPPRHTRGLRALLSGWRKEGSSAAPWVPLSVGLVKSCLEGGLVRAFIEDEAREAYRGAQTVTEDEEGFLVIADVALGQEYTIKWRPPRDKGATVHALRIEATVLAPPWHVLCMLTEWQLMATWNLFIQHSRLRIRGTLLKFWFYSTCWFPWPFHDRHSHVVLSTVDALDEIGAYVVLCSYEPVPEALEPHADACHPDPRRVLASVQRGSAALVEPVFPHEVPEKARDIHLKYQNRGAAAEEDLVAGDPDSVKAGGGAVPQGGSVKERRRRRRGGKRGKGVKPDWSGSVSAERLKAMYGDREGRLRDGVTPGTRVRFVCYTDVRIASPPETLIKWAFHVAMPWVYRKAISLVATIFEPGKRGKPSPYKEALEEGAHLYNDVLERRSRQHLQRRLDGRSPHKRGFSL